MLKVLNFLIFIIFFIALISFATSSAGFRIPCYTNNDCIIKTEYTCCMPEGYQKCVFINDSVSTDLSSCSQIYCGSSYEPPENHVFCQCILGKCTGSKEGIISCESQLELKDKIRCRLENPEVARNEFTYQFYDACIVDHQNCYEFYRRSEYCYKLENSELKKECFLEKSRINISVEKKFEEFSEEEKRNYITLLLNDIQKRVEKKQIENKISIDKATDLIEKIVEIKKMVLTGKNKREIALKINDLKKDYYL
ncbi:MAG: hypothetical protein AABW71_03830 [Nanoarchaeota archaeon]